MILHPGKRSCRGGPRLWDDSSSQDFSLKQFSVCFWLPWVFLAELRLFFNCGKWGLPFLAILRLLVALASLVSEPGL